MNTLTPHNPRNKNHLQPQLSAPSAKSVTPRRPQRSASREILIDPRGFVLAGKSATGTAPRAVWHRLYAWWRFRHEIRTARAMPTRQLTERELLAVACYLRTGGAR